MSSSSSSSSSPSSPLSLHVIDLQSSPSLPICHGRSFPFRSDINVSSLLSSAFPIHRQLRPHLPDSVTAYSDTLRDIAASGSVKISLACVGEEVLGICVWRIMLNTFVGTHIYVDDLVTDESKRSLGVGHALLEHVRKFARELNITVIMLDSGTHRTAAHKFYFREGFIIKSFHFIQQLEDKTEQKK